MKAQKLTERMIETKLFIKDNLRELDAILKDKGELTDYQKAQYNLWSVELNRLNDYLSCIFQD